MEVIATKTGWDGKKIRNEGDKFDMPEDSKASWFKPTEVAAEKQSRGKKAEAEKPTDDLV